MSDKEINYSLCTLRCATASSKLMRTQIIYIVIMKKTMYVFLTDTPWPVCGMRGELLAVPEPLILP